MQDGSYQELIDELEEWRSSGLTPRLWLRDDDVTAPSAELDMLLALTQDHAIPVVLAAIPKPASEALRARLEDIDAVRIATHGWSHDNHAPDGEYKQELGLYRGLNIVVEELTRGVTKLRQLFGEKLSALLVPPWNNIDDRLLPHLNGIGFQAVSVLGSRLTNKRTTDLAVTNVHLDIIDWETLRCHDEARLVKELSRELRKKREGDKGPIGILTHHLVHDDAAWHFLARLFEVTQKCEGCRWIDGDELMQSAIARAAKPVTPEATSAPSTGQEESPVAH